MSETSNRLYYPDHNGLIPFQPEASSASSNASLIFQKIETFMQMKNYPCVAALQSFANREFMVGLYPHFGTRVGCKDLRQDLLFYLQRYQTSKSQLLSFWAIYESPPPRNEDDFEIKLWEELSHLTSEDQRLLDRDPRVSDDPNHPSFCLSIAGQAFFVVGMHPNASRISRRFPLPALIFNVFEQFELLEQSGGYEKMVRINRARDLKLQQSLNPMVEKYGDRWESIQFSGKENPDTWRCPFQYQARSLSETSAKAPPQALPPSPELNL